MECTLLCSVHNNGRLLIHLHYRTVVRFTIQRRVYASRTTARRRRARRWILIRDIRSAYFSTRRCALPSWPTCRARWPDSIPPPSCPLGSRRRSSRPSPNPHHSSAQFPAVSACVSLKNLFVVPYFPAHVLRVSAHGRTPRFRAFALFADSPIPTTPSTPTSWRLEKGVHERLKQHPGRLWKVCGAGAVHEHGDLIQDFLIWAVIGFLPSSVRRVALPAIPHPYSDLLCCNAFSKSFNPKTSFPSRWASFFNENCTQQSASSNSAMGRFDWFGAAAPPLSFTTDPIRAETEAPVAFDVGAGALPLSPPSPVATNAMARAARASPGAARSTVDAAGGVDFGSAYESAGSPGPRSRRARIRRKGDRSATGIPNQLTFSFVGGTPCNEMECTQRGIP